MGKRQGKIKLKCDYCGKDIFKTPYQISHSKKHYCSKSCSNKDRSTKLKTNCAYCGKEIMVRKRQFERYNNNFCNADCQKKYAKQYHINQFLNPIPCKYCGKIFKPITQGNVYCSHKCWSNDYRKTPEIILKENYAIIKIKYKNEFFEVMIDKEDIEKCQKYSWQLLSKREKFLYFRNCEKELLHRYIMDCPPDVVVDHINHNTLDNRKQNLRICTFRENIDNRNLVNKKSKTGYTYITIKDEKFVVRVKKQYLGAFETLNKALGVRDEYLKGES